MTRSQGRDRRERPGFSHKIIKKTAGNKYGAVPHAADRACYRRHTAESQKVPKVLTCFSVLVCPEGAGAEMIPLARRWDSSVTDI